MNKRLMRKLADEIDFLAIAMEVADNTLIVCQPLSEDELSRIRIARRIYSSNYRKRHADRILARSIVLQPSEGRLTKKDVETQLTSQKGLCWWCGKPYRNEYHIDHRIPLAKGGPNTPGNIVISCPNCNLSKGSKLPQNWNGRLL